MTKKQTVEEKGVWERLVKPIECDSAEEFGVEVERPRGKSIVKLQIFELIVAALFARLRPNFEWSVTPVSNDEGADFKGAGNFFEDGPLEIKAEIRVGGQCKKQNKVKDAVASIESGMTRMAKSVNPTFFVVALSARLGEQTIRKAVTLVQEERRRHCHVYQRAEIEGLIHANLPLVSEILEKAADQASLKSDDVTEIVAYFSAKDDGLFDAIDVSVSRPRRSGLPLRVSVKTPRLPSSTKGLRLFWRPPIATGDDDTTVTLLDPIEAEREVGIKFETDEAAQSLVGIEKTLELVTHAAGSIELGEIAIGSDCSSARRVALPAVYVGAELRPRFFARPFQANRARLDEAFSMALGDGVAAVGVVGAGGSGKSRLCEEFAFDHMRRGCDRVMARQAKILDEPYRLLTDLFSDLVDDDFDFGDGAERVIQAISRYEPRVGKRATPAIRAIFGAAGRTSGTVTDQNVLAALVVLIVTRCKRRPLIVHLQELHWCSVNVLLLVESLVRELARSTAPRDQGETRGVLFVLEGRTQQLGSPGEDEWSSEHFEALLRKLDCPMVTCSAFDPDDGHTFVRLLFESAHPSGYAGSAFAKLEKELVESIVRSAGGNPFHSVEQAKFLVQSGALAQSPQSGLLRVVKLEPGSLTLPPKVFDVIQLRWRFLQKRNPGLALLIWAAALLEDRMPTALFQRLHEELAPEVSLSEVNATDMLLTGEGQERQVAFRHEHYFGAVRQFTVPARDRERVISVYSDWFDQRDNPEDRFRYARALLALPKRDVEKAQMLLSVALAEARESGNMLLARRIMTKSLDLAWDGDDESRVAIDPFLRVCDEELELARDLLGSDRAEAARRLDALSGRLKLRLGEGAASPTRGAAIQRRQLACGVLHSQVLYNDGHPAEAAIAAGRAVDGIRALRAASQDDYYNELSELEMEALHSQGSALALSGEVNEALLVYEGAVEIAAGSSTPLSHKVVSTYANVMLARNPGSSEAILRARLADAPEGERSLDSRQSIELNLGMTLLLRAHGGEMNPGVALAEARELLKGVHAGATRAGRFPTASAAALLIGIVDGVEGGGDAVAWFSEAVIAAARGHKVETLWRARINLAGALLARDGRVTAAVCDNARAALEIMEGTLAPYPDPGRSARFGLIRRPMAQSVSYLVRAGDEEGMAALVRNPALRGSFEDLEAGTLLEQNAGDWGHEWLKVGDVHYVIY